MNGTLVRLLLGEGSSFDPQAWAIILFAIVSALASLYQRHKKQQQEREKAAGMRPPAARPTASPRSSQMSRDWQLEMPARASDRPTAEIPLTGGGTGPQSAMPGRAGPRGIVVPPEELREVLRKIRDSQAPRVVATPVAKPASEVRSRRDAAPTAGGEVQPSSVPMGRKTKAELAARARSHPGGVMRAKIGGLIHNRAGLRAAFALSEILAPPLALRDEHLK